MLVSLMRGEDASHFGLAELCAKAYTRQKQTILDRSKNIHSFLSTCDMKVLLSDYFERLCVL